MNYQKVYNKIITARKTMSPTSYYEKHHILPRSLGGTDAKENLVRLTAREHFICHLLLMKIHRDSRAAYPKMLKAFLMMLNCKAYRGATSKVYAKEREDFANHRSLEQTGEGNSQFGSKWIVHTETGEVQKLRNGEGLPANYALGRSRIVKSCKECSKDFVVVSSRRSAVFCSTKCRSQVSGRQRVGQSPISSTILLDGQGNVHQSVKECALYYRKNIETIRLWVKLGRLLKLERSLSLTAEAKESLILKIRDNVRQHEKSKTGLTEVGKDKIRLCNRTNEIRKARISESVRNIRRARSLEEAVAINLKTSESLKKYNETKRLSLLEMSRTDVVT